jgi:hypothetical protein
VICALFVCLVQQVRGGAPATDADQRARVPRAQACALGGFLEQRQHRFVLVRRAFELASRK